MGPFVRLVLWQAFLERHVNRHSIAPSSGAQESTSLHTWTPRPQAPSSQTLRPFLQSLCLGFQLPEALLIRSIAMYKRARKNLKKHKEKKKKPSYRKILNKEHKYKNIGKKEEAKKYKKKKH